MALGKRKIDGNLHDIIDSVQAQKGKEKKYKTKYNNLAISSEQTTAELRVLRDWQVADIVQKFSFQSCNCS